MRHPLYFEASAIVTNVLDALLADPVCLAAYLFFREGPVVALRGPLSLPIDLGSWHAHLAHSCRGRVRVAAESAFNSEFVVTTGVTTRLIMACRTSSKPGFKARRAIRGHGENLRRLLEELLRRSKLSGSWPDDESSSGVSAWATVPLPGFIKPN